MASIFLFRRYHQMVSRQAIYTAIVTWYQKQSFNTDEGFVEYTVVPLLNQAWFAEHGTSPHALRFAIVIELTALDQAALSHSSVTIEVKEEKLGDCEILVETNDSGQHLV